MMRRISGKKSSLNVAVAFGIAIYHLRYERERGQRGEEDAESAEKEDAEGAEKQISMRLEFPSALSASASPCSPRSSITKDEP